MLYHTLISTLIRIGHTIKSLNKLTLLLVLILGFIGTCECQIKFSKPSYNSSIEENCLPRTYVYSEELIGVPLLALPRDTKLQYTIISGDPDKFFAVENEVIGKVAVLKLRTKTGLRDVLNRERRSFYVLTVQAEARSSYQSVSTMSATASLRVTIVDTNDNIPLFYPEKYMVNPPQDFEVNAPLITVKAQDADDGKNGRIYYYLEDTTTDMFAINPTTGVVFLTNSFVPSRSSKYSLKILAHDCGPKPAMIGKAYISEAVVDISVFSVNNAQPKITVKHLPHVVEHAHANIYAIITVTDSDDRRSYEIGEVKIAKGDPDRLFRKSRGSN